MCCVCVAGLKEFRFIYDTRMIVGVTVHRGLWISDIIAKAVLWKAGTCIARAHSVPRVWHERTPWHVYKTPTKLLAPWQELWTSHIVKYKILPCSKKCYKSLRLGAGAQTLGTTETSHRGINHINLSVFIFVNKEPSDLRSVSPQFIEKARLDLPVLHSHLCHPCCR